MRVPKRLLILSVVLYSHASVALAEDDAWIATENAVQREPHLDVFGLVEDRTRDPHAEVFKSKDGELLNPYPSARECGTCHQQVYQEWSSSNHAYAAISPMFHKFEQRINDLSQGTIGYFCMRCHVSVGTSLGERRDLPLWEREPVSLEGVTCVTCHRVNDRYGKVNGDRAIVAGDIYQPVYGPFGGDGVAEVVDKHSRYRVKSRKDQFGSGVPIHSEGIKFEQLSKSDFCVSCHQVAVHPGIKLEVVWEQYRASPAHANGDTCQDCHMGKTPGIADGYVEGPVAIVNGKAVNTKRKHANHAFYGPGYPIAHPGIFPHNRENTQFDIKQWLAFDYLAGWGTEEFENQVRNGSISVSFPEPWNDRGNRVAGARIVAQNQVALELKKEMRAELMANGSKIAGPFFDSVRKAGKKLRFHYVLENTNNGHNLPSGSLGAQPELWLNVALTDPSGENIWESGYVDSIGDMADLHSLDVAAGKIQHDDQLFNLQTKFMTTNVKGTDREMYLPINLDIDQLPFIRPGSTPNSVMNHPPFVRMEGRSLPPLAKRNAKYIVPGKLLEKPGTYKLSVRLRSRAEPIYFMRFVGATSEMEREMNEWMLDIHPYTVAFEVK